jgi:hypothetical protein
MMSMSMCDRGGCVGCREEWRRLMCMGVIGLVYRNEVCMAVGVYE